MVIDPFSGSGTTLVVAEQLGRKWQGSENNAEYNTWAINRLENVRKMSVLEWMEFDRKNAERRESIR
jgi:site-specific DNA-methyltransferase (adenine-specific)